MRRALVGACLAVVLAVAVPATAQALPEWWEMKPPATWAPLPVGTPENLSEIGSYSITGGKSNIAEFKSTCTSSGIEEIENLGGTTGLQGVDQMLEFAGGCVATGGLPYPCVSGDSYGFANTGAWPSELIPNYDIFESVGLEIRCAPSGKHAFYKPPGAVWTAKLGVNIMKFPYVVSAPFRHPPYFFYLWGTLKLKPLGIYTAVR